MSKNKLPQPVSPGTALGFLVDEWTKNDKLRGRVVDMWPRLAGLIEILAKSSSYADVRLKKEQS